MKLKKIMKKIAIRTLIFLGIGVVIILMVFTTPVRYDGPYRGKVVDAETGEPIEGVVVLGVWYSTMPTPAGGVSKYYDAEETVTDEKGEFKLKGQGLLLFSRVEPPWITIFKAGYNYYSMSWEELEREMKKERGRPVIPLKRLTMEERRKAGTPMFPSEAYREKKIRLFIKEINKEEVFWGRKPYPEE